MTVEGVDVNGGKGPVDWYAVRSSGRQFAEVKATEGVGWVDPRLGENRGGAGLVFDGRVALYHWARPDILRGFAFGDTRSADMEADWYCDTVAPLRPGEMPMVDFEEPRVDQQFSTWAPLGDWLYALVARVEYRLGVPPFLYTFADYWNRHVGNDGRFARLPLDLAAYQWVEPPPPPPWSGLTVWQYSSSGSVPGVSGACDLDRFNGSLADWDALARRPAPMEDDDVTMITADWMHPRASDGRQAFYELRDVAQQQDGTWTCSVLSHNDAPLAPDDGATPGSIGVAFLWWYKTVRTATRPRQFGRDADNRIHLLCEASPTYVVGYPGAAGHP